MTKFDYTHGIAFVIGIAMSAIVVSWANVLDKGMSKPAGKDANDIRIEQHNKCRKAGMESKLDSDDNLICEPKKGIESLYDYWERQRAEAVIAEKTGKKPKKDPDWPVDPNSFETKSKRTE